MLTKETKKRIDSARDILVGQLPLPSDQVELITIALIYKFMDDIDEESRSLGGKPTFFVGDLRDLNWRSLITNTLSADERVTKFIRGIEAVSTARHIPDLFKSIFKNTFLKFRDGRILKLFLDEINGFAYDHSEELGNAFEYLLDTMGTQGDNGQFRTPRNIIEFIVDVVDPQKEDTILDPACGTAGFLISAYKHILESNTSPRVDDQPVRLGDLLTGTQKKKLTENITGYDITPLMARLSRVNMYLHHFPNPVVQDYDTLTNAARWDEKFDCILANPPFMSPKGGVSPHNRFRIAANRTEVLFADYILEHLTPGGKAGFIVPEGIIFQNNDDYVALRKWLINEAGLWAVVSLPAQIFQPYSGVKTSVLLIDRALARTRNDVLLVKVENDGFSLNTNRNPIPENDLPAALKLLTTARRADYAAQLAALNSPLQHKLVPREDFAKLDAYKASSAAFDFCRKLRMRADKAEKALAEAREQKNTEDAAKAEKTLATIRKEFPTATGLGALPATLEELKTRFDATVKEPAIAFGADPKSDVLLTVSIKEHLDNQRDFPLTIDTHTSDQRQHHGFPIARLGDVTEQIRNGWNLTQVELPSGTPVSRIETIWNGTVDIERVRYTSDEVSEDMLLKDGDILLSHINSVEHIGKTAIFESKIHGRMAHGINLLRLTPDRRVVEPKYLLAILKGERIREFIRANSKRAVNQASINMGFLRQIAFPLPPLEEQRAIVAELESYQRVVDGCQTVLGSYKPSLRIDPDWPLVALGDVAKSLSGGTPAKTEPEFWNGSIPWVSPKDMKMNVITDTIDHISKRAVSEAAVNLVPPGALLCVIRSGILAHTFPVALAGVPLTFNQDINAFIVDREHLSPEWLFYVLRTLESDILARGIKRGGTVHSFQNGFLRAFPVPVPPLETQQAIVAELQKEQATLAGVAELKAKFESRLTARLAAVWGAAPALELESAPALEMSGTTNG